MGGRTEMICQFFFLWAELTLFWMLLVGKWDPTEFIAGLVCGVIASAISILTRAQAERHFSFLTKKPHPLLEIWRLPQYLLTGSAEILHGLAQQLLTRKGAQSRLRAVSFWIGPDDSSDRARRALAIGLTSATPNFVVLGADRKNGLLIFHQIVPGDVLKMTCKLGAGYRDRRNA